MKKSIVYLLLVGVLAISALAQPYLPHRRKAFRPSTAVAATYLLEENFENTGSPGYDVTSPAWSETLNSGTINENFSTSGLDLQASECLRILGGGSITYATWQIIGSQIHGYFELRLVTGGDNQCITLSSNSIADYFAIRADPAIGWDLKHGSISTNIASGGVVANGTTYFCWWDYAATNVTGVDLGTANFTYNTTRTKPSTNYLSISTGNGSPFDVISPRASGTQEYIFDRVLLDDVAIGSNP